MSTAGDPVASYLDASTVEPRSADLIWVFGTRRPEPAQMAADLYLRGIAPLVVVTGGANRHTGIVEAEEHARICLAHGAPARALLVENRSTNTLENVLLALPLVAARRPLSELRRIVVVTKWYHSRRALMTLRRHLPAGITYYAATYEPVGIGREDWLQMEEGRRAVLKETEAIPRYLARDHIAPVVGDSTGYR